jgi:hypothetical protein
MPYQTRRAHGAAWGEHLYVMAAQEAGLVKVGRSWDPERRCRDIGHACPWLRVELVAVFHEAGNLEGACHRAIQEEMNRTGREWFRGTATEAIRCINDVIARVHGV